MRNDRGRAGRGAFPPAQIAEVKALACELPAKSGVSLSRWSAAEVACAAIERGIVAQVSGITVWRWLREDAIGPWNYRSWIFPRDPRFAEKAGPILDLYEGRWEGQLLEPGDFVVCADQKPSIQARARIHPTEPTPAGLRVEHEYERAAWHHRRAPAKGVALRRRQAGQPAHVLAISWKAQQRLHRTWRRLDHDRGKRRTIVAVACARELTGAAGQEQLDIYGDLMQTAWIYATAGGELDADTGRRLAEIADLVCAIWRRPDSGIWEVRSEPLHFTHSKIMCWVALDRAQRLAEQGYIAGAHAGRWRVEADAIRAFIEERC